MALDRSSFVLVEVREGIEIGHQPLHQPDHIQIPTAFLLQVPTGLNLHQIPIDLKFEKIVGVVSIAAGQLCCIIGEAACDEIEQSKQASITLAS